MKTRHTAPLVLALAFSLALPGCATAALDAKSAHDAGEGTVRVFDATPQEVWDASHAVLKWNPVGRIAGGEAGHYFVTDPSDFDQIGIWVEPVSSVNPTQTRLTVVVMDDPNLPGPNEQGVVKDVATAITLARNGRSTEKRP